MNSTGKGKEGREVGSYSLRPPLLSPPLYSFPLSYATQLNRTVKELSISRDAIFPRFCANFGRAFPSAKVEATASCKAGRSAIESRRMQGPPGFGKPFDLLIWCLHFIFILKSSSFTQPIYVRFLFGRFCSALAIALWLETAQQPHQFLIQ